MSTAEKFFNIRCYHCIVVGILRVSRQFFQCRKKLFISYHITKRMHKKSSFAVNISMIGTVRINLLASHNRKLVLYISCRLLHAFQVSFFTGKFPCCQLVAEAADPLLYPHMRPVAVGDLICPPFMTELVMKQPVKIFIP